jgi:hypothetical protein
MFSTKYIPIFVALFIHCVNSNAGSGEISNTTRVKRGATTIYDKTFKKERVSSAAFTKVGSTRLAYKTWPK